MSETEDHLRQLQNKLGNYEQTVKAVLAFSAFVLYDSNNDNAGFGFGRRMRTSEENEQSPDTDVTPDLVVQKSKTYGIVAEVKKTLNRNKDIWVRTLEQLRKYDDKLVGWWTNDEQIKTSNATILIHSSRSREFKQYLEEQFEKDPSIVGPNSSIIEFHRFENSESFFNFRLEYGTLYDEEIHDKLHSSVNIPLDGVVRNYPGIEYYDFQPPLPKILSHLWLDVFASRISEGEYDEEINANKIKVSVSVSVSEATNELQNGYGSGKLSFDNRSTEFPKIKWVRRAFEWFAKEKMAIPPENGCDIYTILYKKIQGDVEDRFVELVARKMPDDESKGQEELFNESE